MIQTTASSSFVHGAYNLKKGESQPLPDALAEDLRKAGLVTFDKPVQEAVKEVSKPTPRTRAAKPASEAKTNSASGSADAGGTDEKPASSEAGTEGQPSVGDPPAPDTPPAEKHADALQSTD